VHSAGGAAAWLPVPQLVGRRQRAHALGLSCRRVKRGVFFRVLGLGYETSVRVLAVIRRPEPSIGTVTTEGTVLVGERIQDPRNVGVLVRTVDAWRLPCAVFSRESADPWSRAAVRSSTGSIFRVRLAQPVSLTAFVLGLKERSVRVIGASAHASVPCWDADLTGSCALVVGNETEGLSDELRAACDALVTVPMCGGADSFNVTVAAGHAMIGISLGPVTGRLVADLVAGCDPGVDLSLTAVARYG